MKTTSLKIFNNYNFKDHITIVNHLYPLNSLQASKSILKCSSQFHLMEENLKSIRKKIKLLKYSR